MWKKWHSFAEQDYFTSMWNTFLVCLFRSAEITEAIVSLSHSMKLHIVLRISLVLPIFSLNPTTKIWRDFSTSSPSLILRASRLSVTKLYIFYKLKNVQSQAKLNMSEWNTSRPRDHGDGGAAIGPEHRE